MSAEKFGEGLDGFDVEEIPRGDTVHLSHRYKWHITEEPLPFSVDIGPVAAGLWSELMDGQSTSERALAILMDPEITDSGLRPSSFACQKNTFGAFLSFTHCAEPSVRLRLT